MTTAKENLIDPKNLKKYVAELIGTAALVFIGCGSAVIAGGRFGLGNLGISLAFGLTVLAMVYAIGPISGCHINPAITIAMFVAKKIESKDAMFYIVFQCVGAIIGAAILLAVVSGAENYSLSSEGEWQEHSRSDDGLGQNGYRGESAGNYSISACFTAEVALTFLFLLVVFGSTSKSAPEGFAGLSIGFSLVFIHLVGIPVTGTSVNPARSLGPALLVGGEALKQLWLFLIAPAIGSIIGAVVWKYIFEETEPSTD